MDNLRHVAKRGTVMKGLFWRHMWLIAVLCCGLSSLPSSAHADPPDASSPHSRRFEKLVEEINLDQKTLSEVKKVLSASQAKHKELFGQLRTARERMRSLLKQENPDEAAVMAQADALGALETEARKQRLRTMLQVQALLTAEQRAKLLERLQTRRPHGRRGFRKHEEDQRECRPPVE